MEQFQKLLKFGGAPLPGFSLNQTLRNFSNHARSVGLNKNLITQLTEKLRKNSKLLTRNLYFSHNDLNPRNIIITQKRELAFIDWSSANLNNRLYDLVFLWFCSLSQPKLQNELRNRMLNMPEANLDLFALNQILTLPRFMKILKDSLVANLREYRAGQFNIKTKEKIDKRINRGLAFVQKFLKIL